MKRRIISAAIVSILAAVFLYAAAAVSQAASFTGNDWVKLRNAQKAEEVKTYIKGLRSQGVTVRGDAIAYCRKLDTFYEKHPDMKKEDCGKILKTIIIMEYDWDQKGVDKDTLAKQWLGEEVYTRNKARRGK
ncbi:MAG: hypothetical protein WC522_01955 [Candidatus Omnitrophota bacterium]